MIIADVIWPALYIALDIYNFWYIVFLTIAVETICIKIFLTVTISKSLLISVIGNFSSAFIGTVIMTILSPVFVSIFNFVFRFGDFSVFGWIFYYLILCFGSIIIEIITVKLLWKYPFRKLILPLSIGNILSYLIIIYLNNFNVFYKGINIQ